MDQATPASKARTTSIVAGLIGRGITQSRSPETHEAEAAALGFPLAYRLLDFDQLALGPQDLGTALAWAERCGLAGVNVTHPFKQAVLAELDSLSGAAETLQAVNTVVFDGGKRIGHNTDWSGYRDSFARDFAAARLGHVVQIGAGGAAAAVGYALLASGTERLTIVDIDSARATKLAELLGRRFAGSDIVTAERTDQAIAEADGLVQTSPVGMTGHPGMPLAVSLLRPDLWVSDIIYTPAETELLAAARALECRTANGLGMLVLQAADAFELFTGRTPDRERMLRRAGC